MKHLPLLALLLAPFLASAAEKKGPSHDLSDFGWSRTVSGPALSEGKLKGKGFVLCAWVAEKSTNPGPILTYLQKASVEYKDTVLFAAVDISQPEKSNKEITTLAKASGVTYTVLSGLKRNPFGDIRLIPTAFVFNREGKLLYSGGMNGTDFLDALKQAALPVPKDEGKPGEEKPAEKTAPKLDPKKAG